MNRHKPVSEALFGCSRALGIGLLCALVTPVSAQFIQPGIKLTDPTAANEGYSVALSGDGSTALVGAYNANNGVGASTVFVRTNGIWTQQGPKLVGNDSVGGASQGWSVGLSSDGNTAIVGGSYDRNGFGAAWIYTRTNSTWSQQGSKLVPSDPSDQFPAVGWSVALSADGNTAIVGGAGDNSFAGATWVFVRSNGVWSQQGAKIIAPDAVGAALQGNSVALSADGNTAVIGGPQDDGFIGAAWVYTRTGSIWSEQKKLIATGDINTAEQGQSVSISGDGSTVIVGGSGDNNSLGAAWIYTRSGVTWTQQAKLVGSGASVNASQGQSVALSGDGNTAIVGGGGDSNTTGAAWVFIRSGGVWSQPGSKIADPSGAGANQGQSVAISADSTIAILGGSNDTNGVGASWVYGIPPILLLTDTHIGAIYQGQTNASYSLLVKNIGGSTNVGMVTVTEKPPTGLIVTALTGTGWSCSVATLICSRTDPIAAGQTYPPITVTGTIAGNASGSVTNLATVAGAGSGSSIGPPNNGGNGNDVSKVIVPGSLAQWGDATHNQGAPPAGLNNVVGVSAGLYHTLALRTDKTVAQWGDTSGNQGAPPAGLNTAIAVSAGGQHSLALKTDGTVVQWGDTLHNQGAPPAGLSAVLAISAGGQHSLALKTDGTVVQWGDTTHNQGSPPTGLSNVVAVSAGFYHSLALKSNGTVVQWGDTTANQGAVPQGAVNLVAISAGKFHSLALNNAGAVVQWGSTASGQGAPPANLGIASVVSAGGQHSLALKSDGTVAQWGDTTQNQGVPLAGFTSVMAIAAGGSHSLALIPPITTGSVTALAGTPQSTGTGTQYGTALQAKVLDANAVAVSGATVTFSIQQVNGAGASFASGQTATAQTGPSGIATAPALTANQTLGQFTVTAAVAGVNAPATFTLTNALVNGVLTANAGTPQTVLPGALFAALKAKVTHTDLSVVSGAAVTFTVMPGGNGAGASFGGSLTAVIQSGADGIATAPALTANALSGSFTVVAGTPGVAVPATFTLTNLAVSATGGSGQSAVTGNSFANQLQATVSAAGVGVPGITVTFTAPASGASVTFPSGNSATTDASGVAKVIVKANAIAGSYTVGTTVGGISSAATFSLTNAQAFITSVTLGYARGGFVSGSGMQFTVGSSPLTVSALGRLFADGNSGTHTVKLINATSGNDLPGGSVSVNMLGGTSGQFVYAPLASPIVLAANTSYYLVSSEGGFGEVWYDSSLVVTSTAATVNASVYNSGVGYDATPTSNSTVVPLNFIYSSGTVNQPPTVSITAPASGATISGKTVPVSATASATAGQTIASVQFKLDGNSLGSVSGPGPFNLTFDSTLQSNASHSLTAIATDSLGASATSQAITVVISNGGSTPPQVSVTAPGAGAIVSGNSVNFSATASAVAGQTITSVQLFVDGNALGAALANSPYQRTWDTTAVPDGSHSLTAQATDSAGKSATSAAVVITVKNVIVRAPVPFITGVTLGYAHGGFISFSGMQFTVGASPLTVTSLGRVFVDGNSGTHTVKLVSAPGGNDVPGGSVSINMQGGTSGQFVYAPLASPLVLPANASYYLVSSEGGFGDLWYDSSSVTTTAAAAVIGSVYSYGAGYDASQTSSTTVVPVNFLYSSGVVSQPPTVTITAPSSGATVSGKSVTISAAASASAGQTITSVQFKLDGNSLGSVAGPGPYNLVFDSTLQSNASHSLTATATDSLGASQTSQPVTVVVNNGPTPPTVSITAPSSNATVSGKSVNLSANASAASGLTIASVQFKLDGSPIGAAVTGSSPYSATLDSTTLSNGTHVLTALATDSASGTTLSSPVNVRVSNTPPTVSITSPAPNTSVQGKSVQITATAAAANGLSIANVQFKVDGNNIGNPVTGSSPFSIILDSTTLQNQGHLLSAIATDTAGNSTTSGTVTITVNNVTQPPAVAITAPLGGANVSGKSVPVSATATAAAGLTIASVQFRVDGNNVGNPISGPGPYNLTLDTTALANGQRTLTAFATDSGGGTATSIGVVVNVNNAVPPVVSITAPAPGSTISGTAVVVSANATAAPGQTITSVQFRVDGTNTGNPVAGPGPYNLTLDTTGLANGQRILTAFATDSAGSTAVSNGVSVTVNNTQGPTPFITGQTLGTLRNDFSGYVGMQFTVGNAPISLTSVGRIYVSGNSQLHTLKLVDAATGLDVSGGTVYLFMSGATPGSLYQYATLSAPVVLPAHTSYYLLSQEGYGDQWYDLGPVRRTTVATVDAAVYGSGFGYVRSGAAEVSFGPVNFLYTVVSN